MTNEEIYGAVYDDGYTSGLKDAWEMARAVMLEGDNNCMSYDELKRNFGVTSEDAVLRMPVSEVKAKYDKWKKNAVHVGDLIHTKRSDKDMVITGIVGSTPTYHAVDTRNGTGTLLFRNEFVTTGKHYDLPWVKNGTD